MDHLGARPGGEPCGGIVRLVTPSPTQVLAAACHARGVLGRLHLDDRTARAVLERLEVDVFVHPVWWVDVTTRRGAGTMLPLTDVDLFADELERLGNPFDDDDDGCCTCGRVALGDVVSALADATDRQRALDLHVRAMTDAFDHYWAGDTAVGRDAVELADGVCPRCLTDGAVHVAAVGAEAESLAEELGAVIAAHASTLRLGAARYDAASASRWPALRPCVDDPSDR